MKPEYDLSQPPDTVCPSCRQRWPGTPELCPNCGKRLRGRAPFTWSCGVVVLVFLAVIFGCVGACGLVMVLQPGPGSDVDFRGLAAIIGAVALVIAALLVFGALKLGRRS